ncbi:sister chromatid separation protein Src1 [Teratosphaeria destructans]|uniref:Sister chromatid separation protein Src1 n=1 Tax=Teratosphaeria destructans TaxID=418781 RepID=A0A9W7SW81_9PEZI|nr:sister chromatid separation protein Src1 [Teratosphaeria destructans]
MDDQAYLEPGFDPKSLTMPRLRCILVAHEITFPTSAKKQVLVNLFDDKILPQAHELRDARARVKRSSRGIEDVPSVRSQDTSRGTKKVRFVESQNTAEDDKEKEEEGQEEGQEEVETPALPSTGSSSIRAENAQEMPSTPQGSRHSTTQLKHTPSSAQAQYTSSGVENMPSVSSHSITEAGRPPNAALMKLWGKQLRGSTG